MRYSFLTHLIEISNHFYICEQTFSLLSSSKLTQIQGAQEHPPKSEKTEIEYKKIKAAITMVSVKMTVTSALTVCKCQWVSSHTQKVPGAYCSLCHWCSCSWTSSILFLHASACSEDFLLALFTLFTFTLSALSSASSPPSTSSSSITSRSAERVVEEEEKEEELYRRERSYRRGVII